MNIIKPFSKSWKSFVQLIYPNLCFLCGDGLVKGESGICIGCDASLPKTLYWEYNNNPIYNSMHARCGIEHASAYLFFQKQNKVQKIMHRFKYHGDKILGMEMGRRFGLRLKEVDLLADVDVVMAIPLHISKQMQRGFNQSEILAEGIAQSLRKKTDFKALKRNIANSSQTTKNRIERWENVESIFSVNIPKSVSGKHILLIDDVFTTGATMEACIEAIQKANANKISIATLAVSD
ncbi:MAG: ComF family protein [Flavobacteriales bacterium]|nr:ComF family protein [Flavobacteriales bacterium]